MQIDIKPEKQRNPLYQRRLALVGVGISLIATAALLAAGPVFTFLTNVWGVAPFTTAICALVTGIIGLVGGAFFSGYLLHLQRVPVRHVEVEVRHRGDMTSKRRASDPLAENAPGLPGTNGEKAEFKFL